jgi:hypothetical protein
MSEQLETKDQLIKYVKMWIEIDTDMRTHQNEIKKLKDKKKSVTDTLVGVMKTNNIDAFDTNNGKLVYSKTKLKCPINKTILHSALMQHCKDEETAQTLCSVIFNSRQEKIKESIRLKPQK